MLYMDIKLCLLLAFKHMFIEMIEVAGTCSSVNERPKYIIPN